MFYKLHFSLKKLNHGVWGPWWGPWGGPWGGPLGGLCGGPRFAPFGPPLKGGGPYGPTFGVHPLVAQCFSFSLFLSEKKIVSNQIMLDSWH